MWLGNLMKIKCGLREEVARPQSDRGCKCGELLGEGWGCKPRRVEAARVLPKLFYVIKNILEVFLSENLDNETVLVTEL